MQIKKAGVVAAGALATVAVMGAPAAAAPEPQADLSAFTKASALNMARAPWSNPWDIEPQALLAAGSSSKASVAAWQFCASTAVSGVGATVDSDPNTLVGDEVACNNANVMLSWGNVPGVIDALRDSAVIVGAWQSCGGTLGGGVALTAAQQSPNTAFGSCRNANVMIEAPGNGGHYTESTFEDGVPEAKPLAAQNGQPAAATVTRNADPRATDLTLLAGKPRAGLAANDPKAANDPTAANAPRVGAAAKAGMNGNGNPWDMEPMGLASVGTASAVLGLAWQDCGGQAVWGLGGVVGTTTPNTTFGDCDNGNVWIERPQWAQHVISVLDYSHVSVGSWQVCGSDTASGVGVSGSFESPDTVFGTCNNDNTVLR